MKMNQREYDLHRLNATINDAAKQAKSLGFDNSNLKACVAKTKTSPKQFKQAVYNDKLYQKFN